MKNALHGLSSGFPLESKIATPAQRYVGLYYWCAYWRHWDEIIAVINGEWHAREVGTDVIRKHRTPMWADRFADAPFGTGTPVRVYMECNAGEYLGSMLETLSNQTFDVLWARALKENNHG